MCRAAAKAGRALIRDFGEVEQLQVSRKGPGNFVSAADEKVERLLFEELGQARPQFGFLAEEGTAREAEDGRSRWIVDPLDGTSNFLHGLPHWCISIALEQDGQPVAGVIFDPVKDEMFAAERGGGAFMNNRRLRVSARRKLEDAMLATGLPNLGRGDIERAGRQTMAIMRASSGLRRFGAAALDLAYVAAGRYEGFWEYELNAWDVAAGIVLIREAGGTVTPIDGKGDPLHSGDILGANADLHRPLQKLLRAAARAD